MPLQLRPNAKINLGLRILRRRPDGYHDLESLFHPIGWTDSLCIDIADSSATEDQYSISGIVECGPPEHNLVYRAVQLLRRDHSFAPLHISLDKQIPTQAGLGGGSADAAYTLRGINALCHLGLSPHALRRLAGELGSDCPFFIANSPALAEGRGERLSPVSSPQVLHGLYLLVVKPPIAISTAKAYSLITPHPEVEGQLMQLLDLPIDQWRGRVCNDFEEALYPHYPALASLQELLYRLGAAYAGLSGSGSAIYGFFATDPMPLLSSLPDQCLYHIEQMQG